MIISASWLIPIASPWIRGGAVFIKDGRIKDWGALQDMLHKYPQEESEHFPNAVLLPGLVNVHTHLELTVLRGVLENKPFWEWIRSVVQIKYQQLRLEDFMKSARLGAAECIRTGITTVADPMDAGTSLDALIQSGLRGILFQEVFGKDPAQVNQSMDSLRQTMERHRCRLALVDSEVQSRLQLGVSPHSPYTVSPILFQKVAEYASQEKLPLSIHAAESLEERMFLQDGSGPIGDYYQREGVFWTPPGCSTIQYLEDLGVLGPRTQLVHCIHLAEPDSRIIAARGVPVAHCPKSNAKLGTGIMNLFQLQTHGIKIGLGSDSAASNDSLDLFEEMRAVREQQKVRRKEPADSREEGCDAYLSPDDLLRMATLGGAESLGLSKVIGSIENGKQADLIVVNLSSVDPPPSINPVERLVDFACGQDVVFSMVAGKTLYKSGIHYTLDLETP